MKANRWFVLATACVLAGGCASIKPENKQGQAASMMEFLYTGSSEGTPVALAAVADVKGPLRIGIAFVPDNARPNFRITEAERMELLAVVRQALQRYPFVGSIEVVPSSYLQSGGGYQNLDRVAGMLSLDCLALLSYDQMQFAEATPWSLLYWTGVGAYTVPADRYDILTSVEAALVDVHSHKVLMRAGGTSHVKGQASWVGFAAQARDARATGYKDAVAKLIPELQSEMQSFHERAPSEADALKTVAR